jgi:hypothetical protein
MAPMDGLNSQGWPMDPRVTKVPHGGPLTSRDELWTQGWAMDPGMTYNPRGEIRPLGWPMYGSRGGIWLQEWPMAPGVIYGILRWPPGMWSQCDISQSRDSRDWEYLQSHGTFLKVFSVEKVKWHIGIQIITFPVFQHSEHRLEVPSLESRRHRHRQGLRQKKSKVILKVSSVHTYVKRGPITNDEFVLRCLLGTFVNRFSAVNDWPGVKLVVTHVCTNVTISRNGAQLRRISGVS